MKNVKIIIAFVLIVFCLCTFVGCEKNENKVMVEKINEKLSSTQQIIFSFDDMQSDYQKISTENEQLDYDKYNQNIIIYENEKDYYITFANSCIDEIDILCEIIETENTQISKRKKLLLESLCDKAVLNASKSKEFNDKFEKSLYNNQYSVILNIMDIRNTYLNNLCGNINNIYNILCNITDIEQETEVKTSRKNVDTYKKNNTTKQSENPKTVVEYPEQNNYNYVGYGYAGRGFSNPYYYGGAYGGMMPYSPFGRNPYMPNVDTFGVYKNIDTYKPIEVKESNEDEE